MDEFKFALGDVVLAEWEDKLFYAKIERIDWSQSKCVLIFDDDSVEECPFTKIHSVTETTAEIVCIICKDGRSSRPNEIVLCDKCGIGYHQRCHQPNIPASALEFDAPWMCVYCSVGALCPYLENPFDSKAKKAVSRKRRLTSSVKSDGFASSGNSTDDEGLTSQKFASVTHRRGMSRFYFSSHREGPKPRGRPSFSHKVKTVGERRSRGGSAGRPLGRSAMRECRESHGEREYCFESEEKKTPSHHFQRQSGELSRHQRRCSYPIKSTTNIEDFVSTKAPKVHEPLERKFSHMESEFAGNKLVSRNHHSRPRDAPREKQRLTQDLARQKRLLSEDIARAELLQREQISKRVADVCGDRIEVEGAGELSSCDSVLGEISAGENAKSQSVVRGVEDDQDKFSTLFEKCYGENSSEQEESLLKDKTAVPDGNMEERESLFERFSHKGDVKNTNFVNDDKVEEKGLDSLSANCDTKALNSSSSTASANSSGEEQEKCGKGSVVGNLEPLQFENVTDDELTLSDAEPHSPVVCGSDKNLPEVDSELCAPNGDPGAGSKEISSQEMCPDIVHSGADTSEVSSSEKNIFDTFNLNSCDCESKLEQEQSLMTVDQESGCHKSQSAPESPATEEQNPDHSIIKTSKLDQIVAEPDFQCEHSSKYADDSVTEQVIASSMEFEGSGSVAEKSSLNGEEPPAACHSPELESALEAVENGFSSERPNSGEDSRKEATPAVVVDTETLPVALVNGGHHNSELSNNEGMSDAGEMSEPEIAACVVRGKVKTKKRKKKHSTGKTQMKSSVGNHRSKTIRGRFGSRRGRAMKGSKRNKSKGLESDSDDNGPGVTTADCVRREKEVENKGGESERVGPRTATYPEEGDKKIDEEFVDEERREERHAWPEVPVDGSEKAGKEAVSSSVVDNSEEEAEMQGLEELGKKDRVKKEKRLVAKQKRKSEEKDRERSTPPHLVSQNRFARDLPRHNWLVEQLLQQNKLCGDTINNIAISDKKDTKEKPSDTEEAETEKSDGRKSPEKEASSKSDVVSSSGEQNEVQKSPGKESFHSELHKSFLKRGLQPSVPRGPPKLKPSTESCSDGKSPLFKHKLSPREAPTLEPLPKLKKIVNEDQGQKQEEDAEREEVQKEAANEEQDVEQKEPKRKAPSPIEILDDEEDKKKCVTESNMELKSRSPFVNTAQPKNEQEASRNSSPPELSRSTSFSPPKKSTTLSLAKRRGSSVSPKDHLGRPLHMSPHRAAILIPVVPMHEGGGLPPGLTNSSPHLKGYPPRTFTPHLLTHSSPLSASSMFPSALSSGVRYPGNACMHQHMGPKSGGPCKRDVNCPFHGNQGRGVPLGPLGIPSHHPSISTFGQHGHEHVAAPGLSRNRHEGSKSPCTHPDCKACQLDKDAHTSKDGAAFNDKGPGEVPKVVKPIAHVPGKRASLMLPHLQQHGRLPHTLYRGLEELHEEKARRIGGEPLVSPPHKMQKPGDKVSNDHIVPSMSPLHDRLVGSQPLTLSELNRRREEELSKARGEETGLGLKSKISPRGEFIVPGIPSPSRTVHVRPHSKEGLVLSPGRSQASIAVSQAEQKDSSAHSLGRRIGEEKERPDYASYMSELLKSGPPRLRPVEDPREFTDLRLMAERQKHEELLMLSSEKASYMRHMLAKDSPEMFADRKSAMPRRFEQIEQSLRHAKESEHSPSARLHSSHGNVGIAGVGLRDSETARGKEFEERKRPNSREMEGERQRNEPSAREFGRRGFELVQAKEKEKDLRELLTAGRERPGEFATRSGETGSDKRARSHFDMSAHSPLAAAVSHRFDSRLDPRIVALREMELQRRLENNRLSEFSHRDMLSKMALSFSADKGKPAFGRPDGISEPISHDPSRIRADFRCHNPPNSTTREFAMSTTSRQALDRLAVAAGKSGGLTAESRLKQEMERERERERHQMSVEQYDANRRLLHAELKDKVNPLVFSKERAIRAERERELEAMRNRDKLMERDRRIAMERFSEDRKRKRPDEGDLSFAMRTQRTPPPGYGRVPLDREEYERLKRMRPLPTSSVASLLPGSHRSATSIPLHVEIKDKDDPMVKTHPMHPSQRRLEPDNEKPEMRLGRSRDLDLGNKSNNILLAERGAMWLRERERVLRAQEELNRNRAALHGGARVSSFMRPKTAAVLPSRDGNRKPDEEVVNRCCVCKRDASFLCSGCQAAWYCSPDCQLSAWASHSRECGQKQKR